MDRQDASFTLILGALLGVVTVRVWDIYRELIIKNVGGVGSAGIPMPVNPHPPTDRQDLRQG